MNRSFVACSGLLMTCFAGFVNAVSFKELGGFFISFASGASISIGVDLEHGDLEACYRAAILVSAFVAAAMIGGMTKIRRPYLRCVFLLAAEAALLSVALVLARKGVTPDVAVIPAIAAMGIQNTILKSGTGMRPGGTFVTGTLVGLGESLGGALSGGRSKWSWILNLCVWTSFVSGAVAGGRAHRTYGLFALAAPAAGIAFLCLVAATLTIFSRQQDEETTTSLQGSDKGETGAASD